MAVAISDRIEKKITLRAPRARVWRALTDYKEFGHWFGVKFEGPFKAGAVVRGVIVKTAVDAGVAKAQEPYEGLPFEITIETIEPERLFSFRWHPFAHDKKVDYSGRMPADGPDTVLKVLSAFNPSVKGKHIDLAKTYSNDYLPATTATASK